MFKLLLVIVGYVLFTALLFSLHVLLGWLWIVILLYHTSDVLGIILSAFKPTKTKTAVPESEENTSATTTKVNDIEQIRKKYRLDT